MQEAVETVSGVGLSLQQRISALARDSSIEMHARETKDLDEAAALLPSGKKTYVSHLPGQAWKETIAACRAVRASGFDPVPHIPVRLLSNESALNELLAALVHEASVAEVLLISGDYQTARGPYCAVSQVLSAGILQRHGLRRVSLAGHPEGHSTVPLAQIRQSELDKAALGRRAGLDVTFVTQFFFEATPFLNWVRALRLSGVESRIVAGISGPAGVASLLKLAARCGIGPSIRALGSRPSAMAKLVGDHSPNALLTELARAAGAEPLFDGLHVFSLGGYLRSCRWLHGLAEGRFA
jgi:methylenetetrahydrofolate reductase (NADPH)